MSFRAPLTDPKELAELIESAEQVMLRFGYQDGFHKLPKEEIALILAALRSASTTAAP